MLIFGGVSVLSVGVAHQVALVWKDQRIGITLRVVPWLPKRIIPDYPDYYTYTGVRSSSDFKKSLQLISKSHPPIKEMETWMRNQR